MFKNLKTFQQEMNQQFSLEVIHDFSTFYTSIHSRRERGNNGKQSVNFPSYLVLISFLFFM